MEPEIYLLVIAAMLLILDLALIGRSKVKLKQSIYGFYACFFSFVLIVVAYLSFVGGFLTSDFSLQQVYSYSSSSMAMVSKLYATWAGSAGSILLLILFSSIAWFSFRAYTYKKQNKMAHSASLILGIIVLFFLIASVMMNPFVRYGIDGPVEGRGLNPVLQSVWMAIHPPIVFAGYVLVVFAFALTLAKMRTGLVNYERLFNILVRAGWLFLTVGIGLGGLWAYEVLGWGGYWSWDPIETASLLPWVALTTYFVVQALPKTKKSLLGEFSILLAFSSLMLLSALTRGGLLQSVHAYGLSPAGPFILVFAGAMIAYFLFLKRKTGMPLMALGFERRSLKSLSIVLCFVSLMGIFVVCLSGIVYPMVARLFDVNAIAPGISFFNYANFPFVIGLIVALTGYGLHRNFGNKLFLGLIALISCCSLVFVLVGWPTSNILANAGLPLLATGMVTGFYGIISSAKIRQPYRIGSAVIHAGLLIVLLGVFISATGKQVNTVNDIKLGSSVDISGLNLTLTDCNTCSDNSSIELAQGIFPQSSNLLVGSKLVDGQATHDAKLSVSLFSAYGLVSQPTVIRTGLDDIYIHVNATKEVYDSLLNSLAGNASQPQTFVVTVERIPMINVIWIGVVFLSTGAIISLIGGLAQSKQSIKYVANKQ